MRCYVGLDLGQAQDYTALAILEQSDDDPPVYRARHLERFRLGTSYPDIVARVAAIMADRRLVRLHATTRSEPMPDGRPRLLAEAKPLLVVDATGVGRAVVDQLEAAGMLPIRVTISGGSTVHRNGRECTVPKRDLVGILQVVLQADRLHVAEALPEAGTLIKELMAFRVKINSHAHDSYGAWRDGEHDDLVLAVAMAAWYAERPATFYLAGMGSL